MGERFWKRVMWPKVLKYVGFITSLSFSFSFFICKMATVGTYNLVYMSCDHLFRCLAFIDSGQLWRLFVNIMRMFRSLSAKIIRLQKDQSGHWWWEWRKGVDRGHFMSSDYRDDLCYLWVTANLTWRLGLLWSGKFHLPLIFSEIYMACLLNNHPWQIYFISDWPIW